MDAAREHQEVGTMYDPCIYERGLFKAGLRAGFDAVFEDAHDVASQH